MILPFFIHSSEAFQPSHTVYLFSDHVLSLQRDEFKKNLKELIVDNVTSESLPSLCDVIKPLTGLYSLKIKKPAAPSAARPHGSPHPHSPLTHEVSFVPKIAPLVEALPFLKELRSFSLEGDFGIEDAHVLAEALQSLPKLHTLEIAGCLNYQSAFGFASIAERIPSLHTLHIAGKIDHFDLVLGMLEQSIFGLKELSIKGAFCAAHACMHSTNASSFLSKLVVHGVTTDSDAIALKKYLSKHEALRSLEIKGGFDVAGLGLLDAIGSHFKNLEELSVDAPLHLKIIERFVKQLPHFTHLRSLSLSSAHLDNVGLQHLLGHLSGRLTSLYLSGFFHGEGVRSLAQHLARLRNLQNLTLKGISFAQEEDAKVLDEALLELPLLEVLEVKGLSHPSCLRRIQGLGADPLIRKIEVQELKV